MSARRSSKSSSPITARWHSDAKVTYQDEDDEISRKVTPRETLRHMKELHTFGKLTLRQQKIDAGIPDDDDDDKNKTVNDFVTKAVGVAGKQMSQEAKALGLEERRRAAHGTRHRDLRGGRGAVRRRRPPHTPTRMQARPSVFSRVPQRLDHSA